MRHTLTTFCSIIALLTLQVSFLQAEVKPLRPKALQVTSTFIIADGANIFTCAQVKNKWVPGKLKRNGTTFVTIRSEIKALKARAENLSGLELTKLTNRITQLSKRQRQGKDLCAGGPPPTPTPSPTPSASPTPTPTPDPLKSLDRAMTKDDVQHLFRRAALGYVTPAHMQIGLTKGAQALVDELNKLPDDSAAETEAQSWRNQKSATNPAFTSTGMRYYALVKLMLTNRPLQNHFCMIHLHDMIPVSVAVLGTGTIPVGQINRYFDTLCSVTEQGDYRTLIKDLTLDPAMLYWLDGYSNNKTAPNENYARELMELFTLGVFNSKREANYTDLDVATAARALTGIGVINHAQFGITSILNYAAFDDATDKVIFRGTPAESTITDWEDLIDTIFDRHPNTAYNIALMVASRYVHPDIDKTNPAFVQALAKELKASNFDIMKMLNKILVSEAFYDQANRRAMLRSPAELTVHLSRMLHASGMPHELNQPMAPANLLAINSQGGMEIGLPPTVFGWDREKEFTVGTRFLGMTNRVTQMLASSLFSTETNSTGWNYKMLYPPGNATPTADQLVNHLADLFGVSINEDQRTILLQYLNTLQATTTLNGETTYSLLENPWDPSSYDQARRKVAGLVRIFFGLREFRVY